ncbi:limonene-1,2-epoxide hydrolase family protein [Xanthomonas sp. NCPPB 1325]|uniref:limonene-1,2-epoxide hydrolase family protein n=1 Tax=Xanthomonas sp. NCPPB 1325 TaxID=487529 RepID=UPI003556DBB9
MNEGVATTTGIAEAISFIEKVEKSSSIVAAQFQIIAIAATGNKVLTERLDTFLRADGSKILAVTVMGIIELDGEQIIAWRDYFDVNAGQSISRK